MSKDKAQEIYENLDEWPEATEAIKGPYQKMQGEFGKYLDAIEKEAFLYGCRCAIESMGGEL